MKYKEIKIVEDAQLFKNIKNINDFSRFCEINPSYVWRVMTDRLVISKRRYMKFKAQVLQYELACNQYD